MELLIQNQISKNREKMSIQTKIIVFFSVFPNLIFVEQIEPILNTILLF